MIDVNGKPLIEYKFDALEGLVDEIIVVIGYRGDVITEHYGSEYEGMKLRYVEQEKLDGTGGALWLCKPHLQNAFLVMYADDIYAQQDIEKAACFSWSVVGLEVDDLGQSAKIIVDGADRVIDILEVGDHDKSPGFLNTGLYCLDTRVFDYPLVPKSPDSEEYGLPQTIIGADVPLFLIKASFWLSVTDPSDVEKAAQILAKRHK